MKGPKLARNFAIKKRLAATLIAALVSILGLVIVEAGYRLYLFQIHPERFLPSSSRDAHPNVWFTDRNPWPFDRAFGYRYAPGFIDFGEIVGGQVQYCDHWFTNREGNSARIDGDYRDARLKILVFGDSWTAMQRSAPDGNGYVAWPNFLQRDLAVSLGKSVQVVNFGRGGTGLLQMFDLAAAMLPEWKPDFAIFAFISDDLTRARFWRTEMTVDGELHLLTSIVPDPHPDPRSATEVIIVDPRATYSWCEGALKSGSRDDPLIGALERRVLTARRKGTVLSDPFSVDQSYVYDLLAHGDPFHTTMVRVRPSQNPRHALADFGEDARMVKDIERIKALKIPIVLVHFPVAPELLKGVEYTPTSPRDQALIASLTRLVGVPVHNTLDYVPLPLKGVARYMVPRDGHPSIAGMEFYARAVTNMIARDENLRNIGRPGP